ncbi:cytochrome P450 [Laetiporus sulphureus 93-53]|uniref:Cytochrome P450 n=1 Tax=Laetiporus sulphureus 93-53 TaxID=1314785 RepID=A0A165BAA2_9APHY|nr:cytochrome P450 [Laetiporus sulphureus 93-53]KZT00608.1 cytochrome P450 [Laetiporus sulphureus 93-53]
MGLSIELFIASSLAFSVVLLLLQRNVRWYGLHLPPGPRPIPIIGNAHQMPVKYTQKGLSAWSSLYGDVIYAELFGSSMIILNSMQAAKALLDHRSAKYSDRPRFTLLRELLGWKRISAFLPYDKQWRQHRQWIQAAYNDAKVLTSYRSMQQRETYFLLSELCSSPSQFELHFKRFAGALVLETAYGYRLRSRDDRALCDLIEVTEETSETGTTAAALVDLFPFLKHIPIWMPGAGFKRKALHSRRLILKVTNEPFERVKRELAAGVARQSFVASLLQDPDRAKWPEDHEEDIKGAAAVLYAAGIDTTAIVLSTFLLAMVIHPEIYRKAQEEIDRLVGSQRLPEFEDRDSLPFLECILKEVYRWNPPLPLGITHKLMADDEYRGYHFPGGSMVIGNIWAILHDECLYPKPDTFNPQRFADLDSEAADLADPRKAVFGFGRRICPGRRFADASIWLAIASIVATLDISRARDASGKEIVPTASFVSGIASPPMEFTCEIRPRSEEVSALIGELALDATATDGPLGA